MNAEQMNHSSTRRKRFTEAEDNRLRNLVKREGIRNWEEIASRMPGRSSRQCRDRYNNYLFKEILHKPWTPEEDRIIVEKYKIFGPHWVKISQFLEARSGNNVKNRWHKYLSKQQANTSSYPKSPPEATHTPLPSLILTTDDSLLYRNVNQSPTPIPFINSFIINYQMPAFQAYPQKEIIEPEVQIPEYLQLKTLLANPVNI